MGRDDADASLVSSVRRRCSAFEESDEYCPKCDNHYIIPAKTPETEGQMMITIEGSADMIRDDRQKTRGGAVEGNMMEAMGLGGMPTM